MTVNDLPEGVYTPETPSTPRRIRRARRWNTLLLLVAILIVGGYLRSLSLFGWDEPSYRLHPDERFFTEVAAQLQVPSSFGEYLDSERNPLNPRNYAKSTWFVYGLLPQTLTQFTAVMLTPNDALQPCVAPPDALLSDVSIGAACGDVTIPNYFEQLANNDLRVPKLSFLHPLLNPQGKDLTQFWEIHKVGRVWSVLFDLGSIVLTFLIGRRLYGRRVGLLAALFLSLSVLPIQLAHFFTVDATTGFFVLLAIYWGVRASQNGGIGTFTALGLSIGAAMACRVTLATLGLVGVLAVATRLWAMHTRPYTVDGELPVYRTARPSSLIVGLVLAGVLSILSFRVLQPDAFVGTNFFDLRPEARFIENISRIGKYVSGEYDAPPNQQWVGRTPYLFPLQNIILWGLGLPLGLATLIGWAAAGWQLFRRRRLEHLIPWMWVTFYMLWQGGQFVTTMRYYSSLYGLFAVLAAWLLIGRLTIGERRSVARSQESKLGRGQWLAVGRQAFLVAVVLGTALWAFAFTRIYTHPHARITASRWIFTNIPAGSVITSELWDDGLPLSVDGRDYSLYRGIQMTPYDEDEPSKYFGGTHSDGTPRLGLLDQLDQADYLIFSSNRIYDSTKRLPMKYPALTRYYHALFNGELGFELVADIHSYPTLFGIEVPTPVLAEEAFSVYDHPRVLIFQKSPDYSRARAERLITDGVAWEEVYKLSSNVGHKTPTALRLTEAQWQTYRSAGTLVGSIFGSLAPWLAWLVVLELIGLAAFGLLFHLLPRLPDRGFALSKTLGLLVVAWGAWLLGSIGAGNGRPLMSFSPASVWLCAAILIVPSALIAWHSRVSITAFARPKRTPLLIAEGLFLAAFFGFLIIRALNPDLWHSARGGEKPMDLAFLTATLKSGAFPPYDPWFAGGYINYYYFGFVLVGTLIHLTGIEPTVAYNLAIPTVFALTALGAWGVAYNLLAPRLVQLKEAQEQASAHRRRLLRTVGERRAIATGITAAVFVVLLGTLAQAVWFLPGTANRNDMGIPEACREVASYAAQQECRGRSEWAFWDASRLVGMANTQRTGEHDSTINEFPFFTFLFGDLHAHMIVLPLALAALGLMVALVRSDHRRTVGGNRLTLVLLTVLIALVIGAIGATNTWDYPAYLGLSVLTLGLLAWRRWRDGQGFWRMVLLWLAWSIALVVMARVFFWPFNRSFATDYAGFEVYRGARTGALEFLKINGVWLFVLISAAFVLYRRVRNFSVGTLAITAVAMLAISAAVALRGLPAITLLLPLLGLAIGVLADLLFRSEELGRPRISTTTLMAVVWGVAGIGLVFLPEVIVAKGDIGRMNTVFKLGMQSWVLLALASAVGFVSLWRRLPSAARRPFLMGLWLLRAGSVGLIAAALVYPVTATPARIADRFDRQIGPTLDGTAYMRSPNSQWGENGRSFRFAEDATALDWMRRNITGSPVVLEAHTEAYRWAGRVSVYTGLPTIIGWPVHEIQQRSVAQVQPVLDSRRMLVQDLYNGTDPNEALRKLRLYGVEYVYVGELEQALYSPDGLAKFDTLAGQGLLEQVYSANTTRIYRVTEVQNPPAILTTSLPVVAPSLPPEKTAMLDRPVDRLPAVNEYAWNSLARSQPVAVALWLLALAILTALGLPLAVLVFGRWQDGGYTWAPLIGLLLLGYAVWLPVSAQLWQYNRLGLLLGTLLVLVVNGFVLAVLGRRARSKSLELKTGDQGSAAPRVSSNTAVNRGGSVAGGLRVVVAHLRAHWRQIVVVEALFLLAFSVLLVIRALNPDLWQPFWGGEKPFEFGFLNAILRSPVMPPYNPFYSGGTINYYYYGLYLVSLPVKATGIDPAIAFNLIIPTLFGLMVIGSFTLVRQLTKRVSYGLLGVLFVAVAGNYTAVFAVAGGYSAGLAPVGQALSDGFSEFGRRLDAWFVGPSRVIPYTINEFPFWSFLFADLHPHLIAMPITLLAIALAYSLFADQRRETAETVSSEGRRVVVGGRWALVALTLGALAVTNSWDFPTYALLTAGALVGAAWSNHRSTAPLVARVAGAVALTAGLAGTALLLYLPFFQNFNPMVGGIGVVRGGTQPIYYGVIYGLFLAVLVPAVVGALLRVAQFNTRRAALRSASFPDLSGETAVGFVAQPRFQQVPQRSAFIALAGITAAAVILAMLLASNPIALKLVLGFLLLGVAVLLLNRRLHPATWFALLLVLLGWAVSLGIDVVYIRDHLAGDPANPGDWYRMNTVFKFGLQVWILLALAAASLLPIGLRGLSRLHRSAPSLGMFGVALMTGLALVFALVGTPSRVAYRFPTSPGPTLDGLAFMKQATYDWYPCDGCTPFTISLKDDGEAIAWINQNITGTPVILQSSKEFYRAYGIRIAANTGLPTIVSPLHESEQRDPSLVADRDSDVITFYETASVDEALRLLSKYRVGYVYVGQIERAAYGEAGMAKFDQMNGSYLTTAYKNDTVTLYKVNEGVYSIAASQVESDVDPVSPQPQPDANPSAPEEVENPPGKPTLADLESRNQADPTLASVAFELALRYRDLGRFDDAAGVLNPATRANPNDVALHHLWGDILRDAGRLDEAEEAYRQAAVGNPTASNYNKLGSELLRMGRFDKAEAALIEATAIDSQEPEPYFQLGRVYEQLGKLPQALQSYKRYIELAPSGSFINDANEALARLQ